MAAVVLVPGLLSGAAAAAPAVTDGGPLMTAVHLLETLQVRQEASPTFDPDAFEHWIDADGDGCDTADEVLIATSHPTMLAVEPPCTVVAGSWSADTTLGYTRDPADLTVDHTVPLEEAWESGAWAWTDKQRRDFANDLQYQRIALIPVTHAVAEDRRDKDPSQWQVARAGTYCTYANRWIQVKSRWNLTVDPAEYDALMQMLDYPCPTDTIVPERGLNPGRGPAAIMGRMYGGGTHFFLLSVEAHAEDGSVAARTKADIDGTFELTGLAPGTYRVKFVGGTSGALDQWYSEQGPGAEPTLIQVSAGGVVPGIDVGLQMPQQFSDVTFPEPEHMRFHIITWAVASGYMDGYPDGTFRPAAALDRGKLAAAVYGMAGRPPVPEDAPDFTDVPVWSEDRDAIRWTAAMGIDTGFEDGTFRPEKEVTRRTLAVFLHRLAGSPEVALDQDIYTDVEPGDPAYKELVWLASSYILSVHPNGIFSPDQVINREDLPMPLAYYRFSAKLPVIGAVPDPVFEDVPSGSQFAEEITDLHSKGVVTGWADGSFRPLEPVHRDAVAAFIHRLTGNTSTVLPDGSPFADLGTDHPFYTHISWLAGQKITTGWPDKTYRPLAPVNRDAMAAFLYRLAGSPDFTPPAESPFTDVTTDNQFYKEITWLAQSGITTGWPDHTYRPYEPVNRDAMAAFLHRFDTKE